LTARFTNVLNGPECRPKFWGWGRYGMVGYGWIYGVGQFL